MVLIVILKLTTILSLQRLNLLLLKWEENAKSMQQAATNSVTWAECDIFSPPSSESVKFQTVSVESLKCPPQNVCFFLCIPALVMGELLMSIFFWQWHYIVPTFLISTDISLCFISFVCFESVQRGLRITHFSLSFHKAVYFSLGPILKNKDKAHFLF